MSARIKDILERTLWTAIEGGAAYAAVAITGLPYWWVVPVAGLLAVVKGVAASHLKPEAGESPAALPVGPIG